MRMLINMPALLTLGLAYCVAMATVTQGVPLEPFSDHILEESSHRVLGSGDTCDLPTISFDIPVLVNFVGSPDLVTNDEKSALEQQFLESYNGITTSTCGDGSFRTVENVMIEGGPIDAFSMRFLKTSASRSFAFRYRVQGRCRGCSQDSSLFNEGVRRRTSAWLEPLLDDERDGSMDAVLELHGMLRTNVTPDRRNLGKSKDHKSSHKSPKTSHKSPKTSHKSPKTSSHKSKHHKSPKTSHKSKHHKSPKSSHKSKHHKSPKASHKSHSKGASTSRQEPASEKSKGAESPNSKKGETSCEECSNPTDNEFTFDYNAGVQTLRDSGVITSIEKVTGVTEIFEESDSGDIGSYRFL